MKKLILSIIALGSVGLAHAYRNPNYHGPATPPTDNRAANCAPANERLFMEFNNVRALVETGGSLWQDRANGAASYEVPKGSNHFVLYSGALWMGGEDVNGQLKIAAHMFRNGNDFWAGPLGDLVQDSGNYDPFTVQESETTLYRDHGAAEIIPSECNKYDNFYTIRKSEVVQFIAWWNCENNVSDPSDCQGVEKPSDEVMDRIVNWPAHGDVSLGQDNFLAPFYDNSNYENNQAGIYDPINDGDYPWYDIEGEIDCRTDRRVTLFGDETHWWVFNDKGNIHTETGGDAIGMEIRAQAFSFATDDAINDMTFYNYELINRGTQKLENTYFGQWVDPDIGNYLNDFVGCDVSRGLGFGYNGELTDQGQGGQAPFGASPPAIGVDFFEGPYKDPDQMDNPLTTDVTKALNEEGIPYKGLGIGYGDGFVDNERLGMSKFVYFTGQGGTANQGDPETATEYYQYLRGFWKNNSPFTHGGTGIGGTVLTDYCFPGDSDPLNWATKGTPMPEWSETTVPNPPGDRRFLQSAGPFTLEPGAVNNITVGVVYGRNTAETDLEASIRTMKAADSKAQALFDNCFEIVDPPPAPILTIQEMENELIIYLEEGANFDEQTWYAEDVINIVTPDTLANQGIFYDDTFRFEGYQVYQMVDADASVSDVDDIEKARLVAQCDVKNGVTKLVNYTFNENLGLTLPTIKVDGADEGLRHSFNVTEDLFATGSRELVNHKKYYYIAVSYAYNNFKQYDPNDPDALDGQKEPYMRSRLSAFGGEIQSVLGIPHDPTPESDGVMFTTAYGYQPPITQIEGLGNGGSFTALDTEQRDAMVLDHGTWRVDHPTYQSGAGPVGVQVIDPLNLAGGDYTLAFGDEKSSIEEENWTLTRVYSDENGVQQTEVVDSKYAISHRSEQLILDWGLSVDINQQYYKGTGSNNNKFTSPISATLTYADSSLAWLTGVEDDDNYYPTNWIRSGSIAENETDNLGGCDPYNGIYNQCSYNDWDLDDDQEYENLLGGIIAPFNRVGSENYGMPFGWPEDVLDMNGNQGFLNATAAQAKANFVELHDVDIVLTSNKDYWTRCPVIEINNRINQTEHLDEILSPRSDQSVDKEGNPDGTGTGMGWFPGYAVDVNTGARLNMAFAENSWLLGENGADMIWNPTSAFADQVSNPLFGGMHYIYVFAENVDNSNCPVYDEGAWLRQNLDLNPTEGSKISNYMNVWKSCMWVMEPMLIENATLMATDVEINLRINKPYVNRNVNGENNGRPMYNFSIEEPTLIVQGDRLESVLDNINVVPNPYYGYSSYESSKLDNRVKITNLPERCDITIFNMQGALVRSFAKDDPITSLDWDLKNQNGVPIAGGLYVIHAKVPIIQPDGSVVEHERIIKWYGALRSPDLDNL